MGTTLYKNSMDVTCEKWVIDQLFKAVNCAVYADDTREHLHQIAVYLHSPEEIHRLVNWTDCLLVSTDGHRMHFAASCPIEVFYPQLTSQAVPYFTLDPKRVKAYLKNYKKRDLVNLPKLFADCHVSRGAFPPVDFSVAVAKDRNFDNQAAPFHCNPKYLGDLQYFMTGEENFASCRIIPGTSPLDPIFAENHNDATGQYFMAVIMPMRP